jgi:hypothetical protein
VYLAFTQVTLRPDKRFVSRLKGSIRPSGLTVSCTTCPGPDWPMESSLSFQSGQRRTSAFFYVFVFPYLCMAKGEYPEKSYQISTNNIQSSEGIRPYGALVYKVLHVDRYCKTGCMLQTGW